LHPAAFVGARGPEEVAAGSGIPGLAGARGIGLFGMFHDDAVDVGGRVALVGEAGVDEPAQNVEEGLDASEGAEPEAGLGRSWEPQDAVSAVLTGSNKSLVGRIESKLPGRGRYPSWSQRARMGAWSWDGVF
jgi:hypothetical protein